MENGIQSFDMIRLIENLTATLSMRRFRDKRLVQPLHFSGSSYHRTARHHGKLARLSETVRKGVEKINEFYQAKFNELFLEFNRYLLSHPDFAEKFPHEAEVILLDGRGSGYNNFMLKSAPKETGKVIFVDVGELAPVRSRLQHPKIVSRPRPMA